ncbi:MAG TPA: hypothetical protein VHZ03_03100 [Trebonia sp.]|jgi:hypothetical protein|nr:hypothetical protein [Trebonia sp.]
MITSIEKASSAFRAANPVPPTAFGDAVLGPHAERTLQQIVQVQPERRAPRPWLRPVTLAAPLTAIIAAAVIAVVLAIGNGGPVTRISTAAYTVTSHSGTVSLTFNLGRALTDPAGLSQAMTRAGVPNRVLVAQHSCPPGSTTWGKEPSAARNVISGGPTGGSFTLHPRLMPRGSVIVIVVEHLPAGVEGPRSQGPTDVVSLSLTTHAPTCIAPPILHSQQAP